MTWKFLLQLFLITEETPSLLELRSWGDLELNLNLTGILSTLLMIGLVGREPSVYENEVKSFLTL